MTNKLFWKLHFRACKHCKARNCSATQLSTRQCSILLCCKWK